MLLKDNELYRVILGDCIPEMARMPQASVDLAVFSPPFSRRYTHTQILRRTSATAKD